jgi:hypothetical protein
MDLWYIVGAMALVRESTQLAITIEVRIQQRSRDLITALHMLLVHYERVDQVNVLH